MKVNLTAKQLAEIAANTLAHYNAHADSFWAGTRDHDVSQNRLALLEQIHGQPPYRILDFGCGPGRDLKIFADLGHEAVGLEGAGEFVLLAQNHSGCAVWHQDFLRLKLPENHFDGVFANASLISCAEPRAAASVARTVGDLETRWGLIQLQPARR